MPTADGCRCRGGTRTGRPPPTPSAARSGCCTATGWARGRRRRGATGEAWRTSRDATFRAGERASFDPKPTPTGADFPARLEPAGKPRGVPRGSGCPAEWALAVSDLSHVDAAGPVHKVDVGGQPLSRRRARARARVTMAPDTARRLRDLPKGDALGTAQVAGIMAAKRTSELIPLCHPLPLSLVDVRLEVADDGVEVTAAVETTAQTGVEMEALVAASVAALTVYDMAKAIDKDMVIGDVQLVEKTKAPAE